MKRSLSLKKKPLTNTSPNPRRNPRMKHLTATDVAGLGPEVPKPRRNPRTKHLTAPDVAAEEPDHRRITSPITPAAPLRSLTDPRDPATRNLAHQQGSQRSTITGSPHPRYMTTEERFTTTDMSRRAATMMTISQTTAQLPSQQPTTTWPATLCKSYSNTPPHPAATSRTTESKPVQLNPSQLQRLQKFTTTGTKKKRVPRITAMLP